MPFFLSDLQDDLRGAARTRRGATHRAEDVPQWLHKEYPRMEQIALPAPEELPNTLGDVLQKRLSAWRGADDTVLTLAQCGTLLGLSLGKREDSHRNYPSGGALFPIETYLVGAVEEKKPAVFHYNPSTHSLEKLWKLPSDMRVQDLTPLYPEHIYSTLIVFTSVWERSAAKYGDFTYTVALLEAGHMSENVLLTATAMGLRNRPMAGYHDERVSSLLDIRKPDEQPVHAITLS